VRAATTSGTWASGGNTPDSVYGRTGFGTQTATIGAGGGDPVTASAFSYDGTTWTATTSMPSGQQYAGGSGTQTAGLIFGGGTPAPTGTRTMTFNGSSWTTVNSMNNPHVLMGHAGLTQTAALSFGQNPVSPSSTLSEIWNGTTLTATPALNTGRILIAGFGSDSSAIAAGGQTSPMPKSSAVESWNGSSWTNTTSLPAALSYASGRGSSNTSGLVFGGATGPGESGETTQTPKNKKEILTQIIKKPTKEKFLTENQRLYYEILKTNQITICSGPAGVGKSYIAMKAAVDLLADPNNSYEKLIIVRPAVEAEQHQ
jgi:hypothetical protein